MDKLLNIVFSVGMSNRPEYYSGRGATTTDLNEEKLFKYHTAIKKEFGEDAAKNFVCMVAEIKVLSATTFLIELYNLYNSDWIYKKKKKHADGIVISKNEDGEHDMVQGFASIFSALNNGNRDETRLIRDRFLRSNGVKVESDPNDRYHHSHGFRYRRSMDSKGNYIDYLD
jgi:hypothetical protein